MEVGVQEVFISVFETFLKCELHAYVRSLGQKAFLFSSPQAARLFLPFLHELVYRGEDDPLVFVVDQHAPFCSPPHRPRPPPRVVAVRVAGSVPDNAAFKRVKLLLAYVLTNYFEQILMQNGVGSQKRKCLLP
jgi:hypothetical protein